MKIRILLAAMLVLEMSGTATMAIGPKFLVRVDLNQRPMFDHAVELKLEPVFRWGNEFYITGDGAVLNQMSSAGLSYNVIDREPFGTGYYYLNPNAHAAKQRGIESPGMQVLDQIGGAAICKSDYPISVENLGGDGPIPITGETIPLTYMAPLTAAPAIPTSPILDTIVARITQDSLVAYNARLVNFQSRNSYSDSNRYAREYIEAKFRSFGYTNVRNDTFPLPKGGYGHNVICTKSGTSEPDKLIIIGAHYDSYNTQSDPKVYAPGADDNGSGTSATLEIARALADLPTRKTIIFMAFGAEEDGLVGSTYYAGLAQANGWNIEFMLDMDMIAWDPEYANNVLLCANSPSLGFANLSAQLARSRTSLIPIVENSTGGGSDQLPFAVRGYHFLYTAEANFDAPGWHTNADTLARLNYPYWADVARMSGMTVYSVAYAPTSVTNIELWDVGDGQSLEVRWQPVTGADLANYRVLWGPTPANYTNSASVPLGTTTFRPSGLTEGQLYFVTVNTVDTAGWESVPGMELNLTPEHLPRVPANFTLNVERGHLDLFWSPNQELDWDHYQIYRGTDSTALTLYVPAHGSTSYSDTAVAAHTRYYYRIVAVDRDGNGGLPSKILSGVQATFDRNLLLVDMTGSASGDPSEASQKRVYTSLFSGYEHWYRQFDNDVVAMDRSDLGQYRTVFFVDDDSRWDRLSTPVWANLCWYVSYANNLGVTGWGTASEIKSAGALNIPFGVSATARITDFDCVGGWGEAGFPNVVFDTSRILLVDNGTLFNIYTLTPADPSTEVIMRYHSAVGDPALESMPVAVRRDNGIGKTALISLPLYYIRDREAVILVDSLMNWFGVPSQPMGDQNGDGIVDVMDIVTLIGVVFEALPPPNGMNHADINGDCNVDVLDVIYLIDFTFGNGAVPVAGCAR